MRTWSTYATYMDAPTWSSVQVLMTCRYRVHPYIRTFARDAPAVPDGFRWSVTKLREAIRGSSMRPRLQSYRGDNYGDIGDSEAGRAHAPGGRQLPQSEVAPTGLGDARTATHRAQRTRIAAARRAEITRKSPWRFAESKTLNHEDPTLRVPKILVRRSKPAGCRE